MFPSVPIPQLIRDGYVAPLPVIARERISKRYSCELTKSGCEVKGIAILREMIAALDHDLKFARTVLISAPHTHWDDRMIIQSFDQCRNILLNGPVADVDACGKLRPISFVFSADGAVAYEWADETVLFDETDLEEVYTFISKLNELVTSQFHHDLPIPLGIMIDYRFKRSIWDEQLFSFAEGAHNETDGRATVKHVFESVVHDNLPYPNTVQVAWSAFPNSVFFEPSLNAAEIAVLTELERLVAELVPDDAIDFVEGLESYLNSKSETQSA